MPALLLCAVLKNSYFRHWVSLTIQHWNEAIVHLREKEALIRISRQRYHKIVNCCLHMLALAKEKKAAHRPIRL